MQVGSGFGGQVKMCSDALFGIKNAGPGFPDRDHLLGRMQGGETVADFFSRKDLVRQVMCFRAAARAAEHSSIFRANHQSTGLDKEFGSKFRFQSVPQLISSLHQRNVEWMLEVGLPNNARLTV